MDPRSIYRRILAQDSKAEEELAIFIGQNFRRRFEWAVGSLAEDCLQDLILAVIQAIRRKTIEHPEFVETYCHTIARRIEADAVNGLAKAARRIVPIDALRNIASRNNQEKELIAAEHARLVLQGMESLDEELRELLRRFYFLHQKPDEIQEAMRITESQYKRRKQKGLLELRGAYRKVTTRGPLAIAA